MFFTAHPARTPVTQKPGRELVLRGGYGIFYDLGTGVINSAAGAFPFLRRKVLPANTVYPSAALPDGRLTATTTFGQATAMLRSSLGGLNPVYQVGGPRSIQLSLRLQF